MLLQNSLDRTASFQISNPDQAQQNQASLDKSWDFGDILTVISAEQANDFMHLPLTLFVLSLAVYHTHLPRASAPTASADLEILAQSALTAALSLSVKLMAAWLSVCSPPDSDGDTKFTFA